MQSVVIAGTIMTGRGGSNLYDLYAVQRAWGVVCEKGEIKRVIDVGLSGLLIFCGKEVKKYRQNTTTQADAAVRDPVREEKGLPSRRKLRAAIRADAGWKS